MKLKDLKPLLKGQEAIYADEKHNVVDYDGEYEVVKIDIGEGHLEDNPYFIIYVKTEPTKK